MVAITALSDRSRSADMGSTVCIAPLEQLVHTLRTKVTSWHHNVAAAISETFSTPWRPTNEPVWLLGHRFDAIAKPSGGTQGDADVGDEINNGGTSSGSASASGADGNGPVASGADGSFTSVSGAEVGSASDGCYGMPQEFVLAWAQISRMTYRQGFAPMYRCVRPVGTDERRRYIRLTSDAGWGCMIRVGQMLLATVLKRHYGVSADGVTTAHAASDDILAGNETPACLERQFLDSPCPKRSPFSIFGFVRAAHGREVSAPPNDDMGAGDSKPNTEAPRTRQLTQKLPGDWFGPTTISETIAALVERSEEHRRSLVVFLDTDGVLYEDEVRALAMGEELHGLSPQQHLLQPASGLDGWRPSTAGSCSHRDSDDEFMVVSTPSMSPASPQFLQSTAQSDGGQLSPAFLPDACCDMAESFQELQPGLDLLELQLPPPEVGLEEPLMSGSAPPDPAPPPSHAARPATWQRAVLLLFPLQLGLEKCVSRASVPALLRYFELPTSLGAMGGRPRMAHFFVGRQGRELLYVDPHVVQPAAISSEAFHNTPTVQSIPVEHIDSSISFAFYCRNEADLADLLEGLRSIEASEENAPIHSEPTRPYALRTVQACGTPPMLWCDEDNMGHSFTEVRRCDEDVSDEGLVISRVQAGAESTAPPSSHEGSSGEAAGADDCLVDADCQDGSNGGVVLRSGGRVLCVGAPWAGGTWAEVEEENSIVVEPVPT